MCLVGSCWLRVRTDDWSACALVQEEKEPRVCACVFWIRYRWHSVSYCRAELDSTSRVSRCSPLSVHSEAYPKYFRFAWTMRILGFIQLGLLIITNTTLARRLPIKPSTTSLVDLRAFREPAYTVYCGAGFLGFLGFTTVSISSLLLSSGVCPGAESRIPKSDIANIGDFFGQLITYIDISAVSVGIPSNFAFYLVSFVNAGSAVGRLVGGPIADRIGT